VNVVAIQFDIAWENKEANFKRVRDLIDQAKPAKDSLVVLPEMFATGFTMNDRTMAEEYGGETESFLSDCSKSFGVWMIAGAPVRNRQGKARNKALVFSPEGKLVAYYSKMHPFTLGGEADHYAAGKEPTIFSWSDCTVSPFVCYDLRFPEIFRRAAAQAKPHLYAVIASWPEKRIHHWIRLLQSRAIENQAFVVGVNRIGRDPFFTYPGRSIIVDFNGEIMADAGDRETAIQAALDLPTLAKYRSGLPFLDDMKQASS
jgi:predicted amidohydrolase